MTCCVILQIRGNEKAGLRRSVNLFRVVVCFSFGFLPLFDETQELVACSGIFQKHSAECRGGRDGIGFLHPAQNHATVLRLYDDCDPQRVEGLLDTVANLYSQALLYLQAA